MNEYEFTILLDGHGGMVEAENEYEAKQKAIRQTRDFLNEMLEQDRNSRGSNACQYVVSDLRPREQSVELHLLEELDAE